MRKEILNFTKLYLECESLNTKDSINNLYTAFEEIDNLEEINYEEIFFILDNIKNSEADFSSLDDSLAETLFYHLKNDIDPAAEIFYIDGGCGALVRIKTLLYFEGLSYKTKIPDDSELIINNKNIDYVITKLKLAKNNLDILDIRFLISVVGYNPENIKKETLSEIKFLLHNNSLKFIFGNLKTIEKEVFLSM